MHFTPRQMADLRAEFAKGGLEASLLAAQLLEMVEKLQSQLRTTEAAAAGARRLVAEQEAAAIERQLEAAAAAGSACPACHDAAARGVVARLREGAKGEREGRRGSGS